MLLVATGANAQMPDFSGAPVRIIAPAAAGGAIDVVSRLLAPHLAEELKTSVIVENLPGSLSQTGSREVQNSPADGHTMMMATVSVSVAQSIHKNLSFDLRKDFTGVSEVAVGPLILAVRPGIGVNTVDELVAKIKAEPESLSFGSAGGTGSAFYLAIRMFQDQTGTRFGIIPYKSSAPARNDLLGGHIDLVIEPIPGILPHVNDGKVVALAITGNARSPLLPDVPTMTEVGYPEVNIANWFGLVARSETDPALIDALSKAVARAVGKPEMQEALVKLGTRPLGTSPAEFTPFIASEIARWTALVEQYQIKPN
jgi:tripartite-type tricarboxylate transporter receptor subunit TctC